MRGNTARDEGMAGFAWARGSESGTFYFAGPELSTLPRHAHQRRPLQLSRCDTLLSGLGGWRVLMRLMPAVLLPSVLCCSTFGQTYTIKTFAGGGLPVNVPSTSTSLSGARGVAVDPNGNAFIALADYHIVLRW